MAIWTRPHASTLYCIDLVSTVYAARSPTVCSPLTAVQHSDSDHLLGLPHSERAFLLVKPSASAGDLQEVEKQNHSADLRDIQWKLNNGCPQRYNINLANIPRTRKIWLAIERQRYYTSLVTNSDILHRIGSQYSMPQLPKGLELTTVDLNWNFIHSEVFLMHMYYS